MIKKVIFILLLSINTSCSLIWRDANLKKDPPIKCPNYIIPIASSLALSSLWGYVAYQGIYQYNNRANSEFNNKFDTAVAAGFGSVIAVYFIVDALGGTYEHFKCR
jgi:hypothetical protein